MLGEGEEEEEARGGMARGRGKAEVFLPAGVWGGGGRA